jgi:hypothetical protein
LNDSHRFRGYIKSLADELCQGSVGSLTHIDGAAVKGGGAVRRNVDDCHGRGWRSHRLDRDAETAAPPSGAAATVKRLIPSYPVQHRVQNLVEWSISKGLTSGVKASFSQNIFSAEFGRIPI